MSRSRGRILVVEDDVHVANALCSLLRGIELEMTVAGTGADALAAVKTGGFDLVLLDIGLPDQSGADVCRRIRHELGAWTLPVIATTGYDDAAHRLAMSEAGADDFISKPICRAELLARVTNLLNVRASYKQAEQERRAAEREATMWRLIADCAIGTATAATYGDLVTNLARVLRIELGITDVGYFARSNGVWTMAAASGGSVWPNVIGVVLERKVGRDGLGVRIGDEHVLVRPVHANGELRGYLAITSETSLSSDAERLVRDMIDHLGAVIATLSERRAPAQSSSSAVTMRLPRFVADN